MLSWGYEDREEDNIIRNIEYVKSLYDLQVRKVKDEEYIKSLLLEDYVRAIRKNISKYDYVDLFRDAQNELKETSKKKRKNLETLRKFILEDFLNNNKNFKITNIMSCGYECYAWDIELEGYRYTIRINIPIMKNLSTANIYYANNGMFSFMVKESNNVWHTLKSSYKIEDIADFIKDYFNLVDLNEDDD